MLPLDLWYIWACGAFCTAKKSGIFVGQVARKNAKRCGKMQTQKSRKALKIKGFAEWHKITNKVNALMRKLKSYILILN